MSPCPPSTRPFQSRLPRCPIVLGIKTPILTAGVPPSSPHAVPCPLATARGLTGCPSFAPVNSCVRNALPSPLYLPLFLETSSRVTPVRHEGTVLSLTSFPLTAAGLGSAWLNTRALKPLVKEKRAR